MAFTVAFNGEYDLAGQREFKQKLGAAEAEHDVIVDFTSVGSERRSEGLSRRYAESLSSALFRDSTNVCSARISSAGAK